MSAHATDQQEDEVVEQSTEDQAGNAVPGVEEGEADVEAGDADSESEDSDAVELIGQEKFDALKNDPKALAKELNRAATKKFQTAARERAELEPYVPFIKALGEDPRAAIEAVARQLGMEIGGGTKKETEQRAVDLGEAIQATVSEALGADYSDLAEKLGPVMRQVAEMVAKETAKPLLVQQEQLVRDSAARESSASMEAFGKKFPEWKKHEAAMVELSRKLNPGEGMTQVEYLTHLYHLVSREGAEGDSLKNAIKRINKSGVTPSDGKRVPSSRVAVRPAGNPTFAEAAAAAVRGERFE